MSKIRKFIVLCAVVLMMVVAVPPALAQGYYWDPAWLGNSSSGYAHRDRDDYSRQSCGWYWSRWYGWQYWCWSPWYGWYLVWG
jgi:hypothetical protein